ncbi:MAG: histidine kinase [Bacteroidetes bacterium]|nr:histidine kinase [Bacteroidota bacterium]
MSELTHERIHKPVKHEHALGQLNPHLIFNSLTAIQHFVMLDDKAQALHYLSQLSKFIRLILQYSKNHFNSIECKKISLTIILSWNKFVLDLNLHTYLAVTKR